MKRPANHMFFLVAIGPCSISNRYLVTSFNMAPSPRNFATPPSTSTTALPNSPLFSPEGDDAAASPEFDGFNPFQAGSKLPTKGGFGVLSDSDRKRPPHSTPRGQVSPRQMRMKELTTDLLARLSDDEAVMQLLHANEEFLLEQLNNPDAALEQDSVFTPDMGREERFRVYRGVMEERIEGARAPAAKKALGALMVFVLSRE